MEPSEIEHRLNQEKVPLSSVQYQEFIRKQHSEINFVKILFQSEEEPEHKNKESSQNALKEIKKFKWNPDPREINFLKIAQDYGKGKSGLDIFKMWKSNYVMEQETIEFTRHA